MAGATGGEARAPDAVGQIFCVLMSGCERTVDLRRAEEWRRIAQPFIETYTRHGFSGTCHAVYAGILLSVGHWREAERELLQAVASFEAGALVRMKAAHLGIPAPALPDPEPFAADAPESADLRSFAGAVIAVGYRPAYGSWIDLPSAFDAAGYPLQEDGTSTAVPSLHFMGVPFQRKRSSASLMGVGEDAAVLAEHMTRKPAWSGAR